MDQLTSVGVRVEELEDEELQALSDTERTQGVLLVAEEPESAWPAPESRSPPRLLLLDGIQDPGNVGTLIRGARAFGLDGVLALEGTVDPWNPKTVRGGAGASAHIPVARVPWSRAREWLKTREIPLLVAVSEGEDVRGRGPIGGWALVVGNEGAGVRSEILEEAHALLAVPMAPDVDSLNVAMAGTILMFALSPTPEPHGNA
jgi:TrmH family RNA methyltransferase